MTKRVVWRILQENTKTGKRQFVWATYRTKKQAQRICDGFNKLEKNDVIHLVVRQEVSE